jgi:ketosteroid isomerase-like protein
VATRPLPQPIVFKVDFLRVDGDIAWFEGIPMLKSGGFATDYLPDMGYTMVLKNTASGWRVVHDHSRSDVPDDAETATLRKQLAGVPTSVIPDFWRQLLKR